MILRLTVCSEPTKQMPGQDRVLSYYTTAPLFPSVLMRCLYFVCQFSFIPAAAGRQKPLVPLPSPTRAVFSLKPPPFLFFFLFNLNPLHSASALLLPDFLRSLAYSPPYEGEEERLSLACSVHKDSVFIVGLSLRKEVPLPKLLD